MIVLSLQGGMAVGKTTAARYLARHAPDLHVCLEDNRAVIGQVQRLGLDKTRCDDYIRIQRLWLQHEVDRWQQARPWPCTVMDFGAEEIEFYTLHYPRTIGQDWDVEGPLARELAAVRRCMPRRILFLDAPDPVLRRRKEGTPPGTGGSSSTICRSFCPSSGPGLPKRTMWTFSRLPA